MITQISVLVSAMVLIGYALNKYGQESAWLVLASIVVGWVFYKVTGGKY